MNSFVKEWENTIYPELIRNMPEIDIPLKGIRGWLLQGKDRQAVFFDIQAGAVVPPHSHCAQMGIMLVGEMELTISGETRTYRKGDCYFIPEGAVHSAKFPTHINVIDIFDSADRYKAK
ncbi:Cupin 2 conserved barrel domain protein [Candidatus Zixiibacteriota bacterium]|nr:Cupin 2 conserved barrel domain protein [candidate division Zixibacteria bacterium]